MATRVIDDTKLQNIAVAIQGKDGGGQMTVDEMAGRIEAMPSGGNTLDELMANTLEVANIPSATNVSDYLFRGKSSLKNVIMPNVTSIGGYAFSSCANLALTSLPSGVTSIGSYAFRYCANIPYLDFSDFTQIPTLGTHAFDNTTFPFYFRDQQQLDEWAAATNWSTYASRSQIKPSEVI